MKIENIIYETTRGVFNIEDKISISTLFLFCWQSETEDFAEVLYTSRPDVFIKELNERYKSFDLDFSIRLSDKSILEAFKLTQTKVAEKYDKDGFYKAVFDKDEMAIAVIDIVNSMSKFKLPEVKKRIETAIQMQLF